MIRQLIIILLIFGFQKAVGQTNEIIIIGNVHSPMPDYNADTLLKILEKLEPDIILFEGDSSFFTKDFKLKSVWNENEPMATAKYVENHPGTLIRPFEFEGRNSYRSQMGISQSGTPSDKLLDSLYRANKLNNRHSKIVRRYYELTDSLTSITYKRAYYFNNNSADKLARERQFYQHHKIRRVINERDEFSQRFVMTAKNEKITLREGYNRLCDFWDLRNKTMARNIYKIMGLYPDKKIVVLTGFSHRYYLIEELRKLNKNLNRLNFIPNKNISFCFLHFG